MKKYLLVEIEEYENEMSTSCYDCGLDRICDHVDNCLLNEIGADPKKIAKDAIITRMFNVDLDSVDWLKIVNGSTIAEFKFTGRTTKNISLVKE